MRTLGFLRQIAIRNVLALGLPLAVAALGLLGPSAPALAGTGYIVSGVNPADLGSVTVDEDDFSGDAHVISYNINATTATKAMLQMTTANRAFSTAGTVCVEGSKGSVNINVTTGMSQANLIVAINAVEAQTGVHAAADGTTATTIDFTSEDYGSSQFVRMTPLVGNAFVTTGAGIGCDATGVVVDGSATGVTVDGLKVIVLRPGLYLELNFKLGAAPFGSFAVQRGTPTPLEIAAGLPAGQEWVYENTPITTQWRHSQVLTIQVTNDPNGNKNYTASVIGSMPAGVEGVSIELTADPLVWTVRGGLRNGQRARTVTLGVVVAGNDTGDMDAKTVVITVRPLGDIDGDGLVKTNDRALMVQRLNSSVPLVGYDDAAFDLDGDGLVKTSDRAILVSILNGATIQ